MDTHPKALVIRRGLRIPPGEVRLCSLASVGWDNIKHRTTVEIKSKEGEALGAVSNGKAVNESSKMGGGGWRFKASGKVRA